MCGIVGVLGEGPIDRALVEEMRDRLVHRGPDAAGLWSSGDGRVCLGHRRLTIIDPSPEANQPFVSADGRLAIVLNGEIYNFRSLRTELEREGVVFRTRSDTEVLLEAYRAWSEDCLLRLSGMFAFAIWDESRGRLFCARDRAGEKPFHYAATSGGFAFASELKALLPWSGFRKEIDWTAVADFLSLGFVPDPKTVWEGAKKLPPGHWLDVVLRETGEPVVGEPRSYWDFDLEPDHAVIEWEERIRDALEYAAGEMTVADVPVGTFLSGGVDSSSVTAALAKGGTRLTAFTVGFEESAYDERPWAELVARTYGVEHVERTVVPGDVVSVFRDTILWHYDEPFNDFSYLPTYYVCREARRSITVALSGDGGDEVFGGYGKYALLARRAGLERSLSRPVSQLVAAGARGVLPGPELRRRADRYRVPHDDLLLSTLVTGIAAAGPARRRARAARRRPRDLRPDGLRAPASRQGAACGGRSRGRDAVPRLQDHPRRRNPHEGRPREHGGLARGPSRVPEPRRPRSRAADAGRASRAAERGEDAPEERRLAVASGGGREATEDGVRHAARGVAADGDRLRGGSGRREDRRGRRAGVHGGGARRHLRGEDRTAALHSLVFLDHWLERWT